MGFCVPLFCVRTKEEEEEGGRLIYFFFFAASLHNLASSSSFPTSLAAAAAELNAIIKSQKEIERNPSRPQKRARKRFRNSGQSASPNSDGGASNVANLVFFSKEMGKTLSLLPLKEDGKKGRMTNKREKSFGRDTPTILPGYIPPFFSSLSLY